MILAFKQRRDAEQDLSIRAMDARHAHGREREAASCTDSRIDSSGSTTSLTTCEMLKKTLLRTGRGRNGGGGRRRLLVAVCCLFEHND